MMRTWQRAAAVLLALAVVSPALAQQRPADAILADIEAKAREGVMDGLDKLASKAAEELALVGAELLSRR